MHPATAHQAPETLRTAVFIDGAHFTKALRHSYDRMNVAFGKLSELLVGSREALVGTYFYDALPYSGLQPTQDELERLTRKRRFFNGLRQLPQFTVREGRTSRVWNPDRGAWVYKQKFVDVYLAVDFVSLAAKRQMDVAVLVTGDSDFIPAVEAVKQEGVRVRLACVPGARDVHRDLAATVDEVFVLTDAMVQAVRVRAPANDNGSSLSTSKVGRERPCSIGNDAFGVFPARVIDRAFGTVN